MGPLPGHALRRDGAPHDEYGRLVNPDKPRSRAGTGRAFCECGASSPVLANGEERRAWHNQHKVDVVEAEEAETIMVTGIQLYRRKAPAVPAALLTLDSRDAIIEWLMSYDVLAYPREHGISIMRHRGPVIVKFGQFVVSGQTGFYAVDASDFTDKFELVS